VEEALEALTDADLAEMQDRAEAATPGPWYVRQLDDDHAAGLVAVSTAPDTGRGERWPDFMAGQMIAATLVQFPNRYVDCSDEHWDENASFIAHARDDVPRLIAEIRRSRLASAPLPPKQADGVRSSSTPSQAGRSDPHAQRGRSAQLIKDGSTRAVMATISLCGFRRSSRSSMSPTIGPTASDGMQVGSSSPTSPALTRRV